MLYESITPYVRRHADVNVRVGQEGFLIETTETLPPSRSSHWMTAHPLAWTMPLESEDMTLDRLRENNTLATYTPAQFAPDDHALLDVEQVAELLKVPMSWIYSRTRKRSLDRLPGFRLGKYWRFRRDDVLRWLERQRTGDANA
jgi:excisionase family DNA binding protein